MPSYAREKKVDGPVAGVDEAGRGPLAGPVVAAAVIFHKAPIPRGIKDSKKLTPERRAELCQLIRHRAIVSVGISDVEEIDTHNILRATLLAMQRAVEGLPIVPAKVLVDGNCLPALSCPAEAIIGGDDISLSIAAASIVAKVTRDGIMAELHQRYPHFGWSSNAGYGTRDHLEALRHHGPTPLHRRSFQPVREAILRQTEVA